MHAWMNEWMNEWTNERTNEWMNEWIDISGQTLWHDTALVNKLKPFRAAPWTVGVYYDSLASDCEVMRPHLSIRLRLVLPIKTKIRGFGDVSWLLRLFILWDMLFIDKQIDTDQRPFSVQCTSPSLSYRQPVDICTQFPVP